MKFACVSYSQELAAVFSRQFLTIVRSPWYQKLFPDMQLAKQTEAECETTMGGGRFSVSVGGSFTGRGADIIIIDDPLKAEDAQSDIERSGVNEWFSTTLVSRLNDKARGAIVLVMQRLHEDDLAGKLLREGGWRHLDLPAIAQEDQVVPIGNTAVHHFLKGEALHPTRESLPTLERLRGEMGSLRFSAQYLQRPIPTDGNLIRRHWIQTFDNAPGRSEAQVTQSWDIASTTGGKSDWSVCTTWMAIRRDYYLVDVYRARLEFPSLKKKVIDLARQWRPANILIEHAGHGLNLLQEFRANPVPGVPTPVGVRPDGDKVVRMEAQCSRFEAGQVYFPREAPWLGDLLHELMAFPYARHDDQVDSVSQFLNWSELRHTRKRTVSLSGPIIIRG